MPIKLQLSFNGSRSLLFFDVSKIDKEYFKKKNQDLDMFEVTKPMFLLCFSKRFSEQLECSLFTCEFPVFRSHALI